MDIRDLADKIHATSSLFDKSFWAEFKEQAVRLTLEQLDELDHLLDPLTGIQSSSVIDYIQYLKARRMADEISDVWCGESDINMSTLKQRIDKFFWRAQFNYLKYAIAEYGLTAFSVENGLIEKS